MTQASRIFLLILSGSLFPASPQQNPPAVSGRSNRPAIGREVSVSRHLQDDEEYTLSIPQLLQHGQLLFTANWTEQEGGGRPLSKGTGKEITDPSAPLNGKRAFNRVSAPDANSCAGCHNIPYGISGGGGDFVTNVFVLGQRLDFATFDPADKVPTRGSVDENGKPMSLQTVANLRATTGMFGAGYLEMLARQMTAELQTIRDGLGLGQTVELWARAFISARSPGVRTRPGTQVRSKAFRE